MNTKNAIFSSFYLSNRPPSQWIHAREATILIALFFSLTAWTTPLWATGEGHDHGEAAAASSGIASPRFTAHSDLFEAVGLLRSDELSITIDRYASNEPVLKAKVEVESGSYKAVATFHDDHGDYSLPSAAFKEPGTYAIVLTVTVGEDRKSVV